MSNAWSDHEASVTSDFHLIHLIEADAPKWGFILLQKCEYQCFLRGFGLFDTFFHAQHKILDVSFMQL